MKDVLERIAADIRHAYAIAFEPEDGSSLGGRHDLAVVVEAPGRLRIRTRSGYLAGEPAEAWRERP